MEVDLLKITSKLLYTVFKNKKQKSPTAQNKIQNKSPELSVDWKKIYSLPFNVTMETKLREFQYKLLDDIVFTKEKLLRFKMIDSPLCTFCKKEIESFEHLLWKCSITEGFWQAFTSWLTRQSVYMTPLTMLNVLFGIFGQSNDNVIVNHLILIAKYFIYKCKLSNGSVNSNRAHPPPPTLGICRAFVFFPKKCCKCPMVGPAYLYKTTRWGPEKRAKCPTHGTRSKIYFI